MNHDKLEPPCPASPRPGFFSPPSGIGATHTW